MTKTPKTAEEWAAELAEQRERVIALRADLAAGKDEAESARKHGFATRSDLNADLAQYGVRLSKDGTRTYRV